MDRHRRRLANKAIFTAILMLLTSLVIARPAAATPSPGQGGSTSTIQLTPPKDTKAACASAQRGHVSCLALLSTTKRHLDLPAVRRAADSAFQAPYDPYALRNAYNVPSTTNGQGQTVAIVDAYHNPHLEYDLGMYRTHWALGACTLTNGCLQQWGQAGPEGLIPTTSDPGWAFEEDLDVEMVSAICPNCNITVVEADSANDADMTEAEITAVTSGAKFVSNSFGSTTPIQTGTNDPWHQHDGVVVTASSGDNGYGVSYPAADTDTVAVGGTSLLPTTSNNRGWSEITWANGGSGCSTEPKPSWQPDTGCAGHTLADVSAVANPYTGVAVYDSDPTESNGWGEAGGTSASSPIIAATYALAGTPGSVPAAAGLYAHANQLNDIVAGVNTVSGCSPTYLCKAAIGYDGPTGLGTPYGLGAFSPESSVPADYAIMGDSYSSGEGMLNYDNGTDTSRNQCHRSYLAFGRLYAAKMGSVAVHTACSGATTDNITTTGQNNEPPQVAQVGPNTRLATITIGGNDAGFSSVLARCLNPLTGSCEDYYSQDDSNNEDVVIDALEPKLAATYTAIKKTAPNARVVAVTYPNIFKPLTTCASIANAPYTDVQWLMLETLHLDNVITNAAHDAGIEVLDERWAFAGHELCSASPWVISLPIPLPSGTGVTDSSAWFHPMGPGHIAMENDLSSYLAQAPAARVSPQAWTTTPSVAPPGIPSSAKAQELLSDIGTYTTPATDPYQSGDSVWNWRTEEGCDTRNRVLRAQALSGPQTLQPPTPTPLPASWSTLCPVTAGTWELPYNDGTTQQTASFTSTADIGSPSGIAIDHVVPKADAWYSGMWQEDSSPAGRKAISDFANDKGGPELWAVSSVTNSAKGDKRPDQWLPDNVGARCDYVKAWITVKYEWGLNILTVPVPGKPYSEMGVLQNTLSGCP